MHSINTLTDLIKLFLESNLLAAKEPGFWKWVVLACAVAGVTFGLSSSFCRMWNRRYVFTIWHRVSFLAASLLALLAVLVWPASASLEATVRRRVTAWKDHLFQPDTVPMEQEWKNTLRKIGVPVIPEKTTWFLALPLKTRDYFRKSGRPEGTIILEDLEHSALSGYEQWEPTYSFPGHEEESRYFCFAEAIADFCLENPYLGTRLDLDFTGRFDQDRSKQTYLDYCVRYESGFSIAIDRQSGQQVRRISDRAGADALAAAILNKLVPDQTTLLARWTRKVAVVMLTLSIGLPMLIAGILSYTQIHVGNNRALRNPPKRSSAIKVSYRRPRRG